MSEKTEIGEGSDKADVPPTAVSFFDPALKSVRRQIFVQWGRTGEWKHLYALNDNGVKTY